MTQVTTTQNKPATVKTFFDNPNVAKRFEEIIGDKTRSIQFVSSVLQIANGNNYLKNADPLTIYNAALMAATLNLPINQNLGFAYIVPYNNKKENRQEAQFQIGYKGFRQLAINSNQYKSLEVKEVYEGQLIEDDSFIGYHFDWKCKTSDKIIGYASYFKLLNGFDSIYYLSISDVEKHAKKYSQTYKKGFGNWKDEFDKMAKKTVVKLHLNSGFAPLSIEMQKAQETDQAIITDNGYKYPDNEPIDLNELNQVEEDKRTIDFLEKCENLEQFNELKNSVPNEVLLRLSAKFTDTENQLIINQQSN